MTIAVVAEKPAVARDIARVLGAGGRGEGSLSGNGYIVTWAIGHLVTLPEPHEIDPDWKAWRRELLPMLPGNWPLKVIARTQAQFKTVRKIINSRDVEQVVCATDAGREGELIFRYIYEAARCRKPVKRLWISSLTKEAIRKGFENLEEGRSYDRLADAARGRSRADWLVGLNLSRTYSLSHGENLSVGRVQTPTLAMLVERELAIRDFVPENYLELRATFSPALDSGRSDEAGERPSYDGLWFRPENGVAGVSGEKGKQALAKAKRLPADGEEAKKIIARVKSGRAEIESLEARTRRMPPPLLYDLTELQRHANRLYGISAQGTLATAQSLYESKKLISYPRTDSRYLSSDVAAGLGKVVAAIEGPYLDLLPPGFAKKPLGKRFVNDAKVSDHHAIIPTGVPAEKARLNSNERRIYDLVCRRLLSCWLDPHITNVTTVITSVTSSPTHGTPDELIDRFHTSGVSIERMGWKVLDIKTGKKAGEKKGPDGESDGDRSLPPGLAGEQAQELLDLRSLEKQTRPPKRFTDATLLTAMETAGRVLDDSELSDAMKERGLGTPATRASIIETLLKRGFISRRGKALEAAGKGISLIEVVHPYVKSPEMTGRWERKLKLIERGKGGLDEFMKEIEAYVAEVVSAVFSVGAAVSKEDARPVDRTTPAPDFYGEEPPPPTDDDYFMPAPQRGEFEEPTPPGPPEPYMPQEQRLPATAGTVGKKEDSALKAQSVSGSEIGRGRLKSLLRETFGLKEFRPYQQEVCRAVANGGNALLVMPTGAGKSLCYQLPGIARGGTTLVLSPLIALMEDQVEKLLEVDLRAERIHSGRSREDSRRVCAEYLGGALDFLFIAPERLGIPGFPEFLARLKPVLIAVDEAHCISHWGHDFRPDYRLLGERLPFLSDVPVISMTATATPKVQDDIIEQLYSKRAKRYIHGFRRTNIAIEVVELMPSGRDDAVMEQLESETRRPAIVYAPTRKKTELLAVSLASRFPSAAYHAGMTAKNRDQVQAAFITGDCEVIVATIAFGMGIDKPDIRTVIHTALPGSLEAYYQEIGRAGRDGKPSRAILFHSYSDRKMHEYFHEKSYPDISILENLFNLLGERKDTKADLLSKAGLDEETFDAAIEKLWVHGGALVDPEENISRGGDAWPFTYRDQTAHKLAQLDGMSGYAESHSCRMLQLVEYFGDSADSGEPCGLCDCCAPESGTAAKTRKPRRREEDSVRRVLDVLRDIEGLSTGRLHSQACPDDSLSRREFERLLDAMAIAGFIGITRKSFVKEGRTIRFRSAEITPEGFRFDSSRMDRIRISDPGARKKNGVKSKVRRTRKKESGKKTAVSEEANPEVYEALKEWRLKEARRKRIPAFRIFGNRTLNELAARLPDDDESLLAVRGIGPAMLRKYGKEILSIIRKHAVGGG